MAEKKLGLLAARALLPALIAVSAIWFVDLFGVRESPFSILLLALSYLAGAAILLYVEHGMNAPKGAGFYTAYAGCVGLGAVAGLAALGAPAQALLGFAGLPLMMFVLPAAFELVMGMVKSVHAE